MNYEFEIIIKYTSLKLYFKHSKSVNFSYFCTNKIAKFH
jgi:hypothetical protein